MDEKQLAGFKALLESHKTNSYHLEETDGSFHLWRDLSAEGKLEYLIRDAAFYAVPFEQFAEAVRESVDRSAIEDAALRLALRSGRELYDLNQLLPDDGRLESPPSLVERVSDLLNPAFPGHETEKWLTAQEQAALFKEWREDEAAAKLEDAHGTRAEKEAFRKILEDKAQVPAAEKREDREMER